MALLLFSFRLRFTKNLVAAIQVNDRCNNIDQPYCQKYYPYHRIWIPLPVCSNILHIKVCGER